MLCYILQTHILLCLLLQGVAPSLLPQINEVSDKGTSNTCNGEDWIELYLDGSTNKNSNGTSSTFDLTGYIIHDDKGPDDEDAFTMKNGTMLISGEFLLLCLGGEDASISPQFAIGGDDQITLLDASGSIISTTGPLMDRGEVDVSFAFDDTTKTFVYTSTPSPGTKNIMTLLPEIETVEEMRARLVAQNEMGTMFFDMDGDGLPVEGGFDDIVDLRMEVDPLLWEQMYEDQSYEIYSSFISATVTEMDNEDLVLLNLPSPGRFRPKGQSTLFVGTCMNKSVPYAIDFDHTDATQTLFGVQRGYLRTHYGDPSFVREWAQHRMLARFGLPHLRTRKVRYFVNGDYVGLYGFLEAPDQNYVFQRSFPAFDPDYYGLYKIKTFTLNFGDFNQGQAEARMNDTSTPPYAFERGEHRAKIPVLENSEECFGGFIQNFIFTEFGDVDLAYVRAVAADNTTTRGSFLVEQGLFDSDLGDKSLDDSMALFYDKHLGINACIDPECSNSDLEDDVDVTNFLKNFAVMACLLNHDSPLGNGNNYYLAQTSSTDTKLKMVQYDHNNIMSDLAAIICGEDCFKHLINWSIERPTCLALETNQLVGPLLTDKALHSQYIEYVREFTQSIMMNQSFVDQLHSHLNAISTEVLKDSYNDSADKFHLELDQNSDQWVDYYNGTMTYLGSAYIPFLPAIKARSADIMKQLDAIDKGNVPPRDLDDIKFWEVCVNWKSEGPPESACHENCFYDGCYFNSFMPPTVCDEERGVCVHGIIDPSCEGVEIGEGPVGMENFIGTDKQSFCWYADFIGPIRMVDCPDPDLTSTKTSGAATTLVIEKPFFLAATTISILFLFIN